MFAECPLLVSEVPWAWSSGAKVLGNLSVPGLPLIWTKVGQGPIALAVGAGEGCLDRFLAFLHFPYLTLPQNSSRSTKGHPLNNLPLNNLHST